MAKKKDTDIKIKIAIITGIFIVIAYVASSYVGSPVVDTQWKERAIADMSFGNNDEFPKSVLQSENGEYFVDIVMENRGISNAKTILIADGIDAKIRIGKISEWDYQNVLPFTIKPDPDEKTYPLYVEPDKDTKSFTVALSLSEHEQPTPFQELTLYSPSVLMFEKIENNFILVDQG